MHLGGWAPSQEASEFTKSLEEISIETFNFRKLFTKVGDVLILMYLYGFKNGLR